MNSPKYQRVLLKISGEVLAGDQGYGIDPKVIDAVSTEIKDIRDLGVELAIVIGGGNIFRGLAASAGGMERTSADYMGMLATVLNALALQNTLERKGVFTRVQSAIEMRQLAESYIRRRAIRHLEKKRVVIFAGGTGNPYFTTDTAGALRAMEIDANVMVKATKVDGVYDSDPQTNPDAVKFDHLTYIDALNKRLKALDSTAISLCMENDMPIIVLNLWQPGSLRRAMFGEPVGTIISRVIS